MKKFILKIAIALISINGFNTFQSFAMNQNQITEVIEANKEKKHTDNEFKELSKKMDLNEKILKNFKYDLIRYKCKLYKIINDITNKNFETENVIYRSLVIESANYYATKYSIYELENEKEILEKKYKLFKLENEKINVNETELTKYGYSYDGLIAIQNLEEKIEKTEKEIVELKKLGIKIHAKSRNVIKETIIKLQYYEDLKDNIKKWLEEFINNIKEIKDSNETNIEKLNKTHSYQFKPREWPVYYGNKPLTLYGCFLKGLEISGDLIKNERNIDNYGKINTITIDDEENPVIHYYLEDEEAKNNRYKNIEYNEIENLYIEIIRLSLKQLRRFILREEKKHSVALLDIYKEILNYRRNNLDENIGENELRKVIIENDLKENSNNSLIIDREKIWKLTPERIDKMIENLDNRFLNEIDYDDIEFDKVNYELYVRKIFLEIFKTIIIEAKNFIKTQINYDIDNKESLTKENTEDLLNNTEKKFLECPIIRKGKNEDENIENMAKIIKDSIKKEIPFVKLPMTKFDKNYSIKKIIDPHNQEIDEI